MDRCLVLLPYPSFIFNLRFCAREEAEAGDRAGYLGFMRWRDYRLCAQPTPGIDHSLA